MAGLGIFCKLDKEEFIGKNALAKQKAEGPAQKIVGIELEGHAVPRHGYQVLHEGQSVGEVTTGYRSISTDKSVCMALIDVQFAKLDTPVEVQIRTIAMDFWASLEHDVRYKADKSRLPAGINEEMLACADEIARIDVKMQDMYKRIQQAERNG